VSEGVPMAERLSDVEVPDVEPRLLTGVPGLDQCLSASEDDPQGLPTPAVILLSGAPGGCKSTVGTYMADAAGSWEKEDDGIDRQVIIFYGDERKQSVKKRWTRHKRGQKGCDPWMVPLEHVEDALEWIRQIKPRLVVVDAIQCLVLNNRRDIDSQLDAVKMLMSAMSGYGTIVFISHVTKNGKDYAGAGGTAHVVDVHLHVSVSAKKAERVLEVRKNRLGRAGFQVQLVVTGSTISCGTPAPITGDGSLAGARTALERACERAFELMVQGEQLDAYDFDKVQPAVSGGMWRAGLDMAVKRLTRDGYTVEEFKVNSRRTYRIDVNALPVSPAPSSTAIDPVALDFDPINPAPPSAFEEVITAAAAEQQEVAMAELMKMEQCDRPLELD